MDQAALILIMSHIQSFMSFQSGEPVGFNLEVLCEILRSHKSASRN